MTDFAQCLIPLDVFYNIEFVQPNLWYYEVVSAANLGLDCYFIEDELKGKRNEKGKRNSIVKPAYGVFVGLG